MTTIIIGIIRTSRDTAVRTAGVDGPTVGVALMAGGVDGPTAGVVHMAGDGEDIKAMVILG